MSGARQFGQTYSDTKQSGQEDQSEPHKRRRRQMQPRARGPAAIDEGQGQPGREPERRRARPCRGSEEKA